MKAKFVTFDLDGMSRWILNEETGVYHRYDSEGNLSGTIHGDYIPDPYMLEIERKRQRDLLPDEEKKNIRIKASPTTHNLFNHWKREGREKVRRNNNIVASPVEGGKGKKDKGVRGKSWLTPQQISALTSQR